MKIFFTDFFSRAASYEHDFLLTFWGKKFKSVKILKNFEKKIPFFSPTLIVQRAT
jgi:hypothetical protein